MLVIPAIDLKDGQCVRLRQGRMKDPSVFSDDPVQMARHWLARGARRLHVVDLDGAFAGAPVHEGIVSAIVAASGGVPVQVGGGIRDMDSVRRYFEAGAAFVIIGTQAVKDPAFVQAACAAWPGRIIVGVDAVDGHVATEGWVEVSTLKAVDMVQGLADCGAAAIIYTDVSRDGMLQGVNVEATVALAQRSSIPIIASGGVAKLADIVDLKAVAHTATGAGIIGAISGRALYEGGLDLGEAQQYCDGAG